jgi:hypothetical protein
MAFFIDVLKLTLNCQRFVGLPEKIWFLAAGVFLICIIILLIIIIKTYYILKVLYKVHYLMLVFSNLPWEANASFSK